VETEAKMQITAARTGEHMVAALSGRLDTATAQAAEAVLLPLVESGSVIADLSEVGYVSSAGLRVLLKAAKQARLIGVRFALCGLRQPVLEVLEISGFDTMMQIFPSRDAALA
jgi:anti-anti-sigma factor